MREILLCRIIKNFLIKHERISNYYDGTCEYTDKEFMRSKFMDNFYNDCEEILKREAKKNGQENYKLDYWEVRSQMNVVLNNYGFQPFDVMEDCFSEKEQLKELTKFKKEYLKTP